MILGIQAWIFWLVLTTVLVVIEVLTINLVTVWFAGGALCALVAGLLGASVPLQVIVAVAVSAVLLALCMIFKPFDRTKKQEVKPTNSDRVIGQRGVVLEDLSSVDGGGLVKVMGQVWSARSVDGATIGKGQAVMVCSIEGVKLLVTPAEKEEEPI